MRVFLDDLRTTPEGWVRAYWPEEVIELILFDEVEEISLDHDLGDDEHGTGYDVITWLEEAIHTGGLQYFKVPKIYVHSANSSARDKMLAGIDSIERTLEVLREKENG